MDERIEGIARMGSDLFAEYVTGVVEAAEKLVDNVVANAAVLARDVVRDGAAVVEAALEGLLDEGAEDAGADLRDGGEAEAERHAAADAKHDL